MKLRFSILTFALLTALVATALQWSETRWNFGTINEVDGRVEHVFRFFNDGGDTIVVTGTRSSCGCTTADYTHTAVMPGDSGRVRVLYDPSYRPGRFVKHVDVRMGDRREQLIVEGTVHPVGETVGRLFPESVGPLRVAKKTGVIGDVKQGRHRMVSFILYNTSSDTLCVAASSTDKRLRFTANTDRVAPSELLTLSAVMRVHKSEETGRFDVPVTLTVDNRSLDGLRVVGQIVAANPEKVDYSNAPHMKVMTDRLDFSGDDGKRIVRRLTVKNEGGATLKINNVVTYVDAVKVKKFSKQIKAGATGEIEVEVNRQKLDGNTVLNTSMSLLTNDPLLGNCRIRLVGDLSK